NDLLKAIDGYKSYLSEVENVEKEPEIIFKIASAYYNDLLNSLPESESNPELYFGIAVAFEKILNYQKTHPSN
ncbi:hypothetical protein, partial [Escherichia coli]|uniref:hypothetical protein n=1 Tax=Escherichia coli TaxID=562 RepID=UPI00195F7961